MVVLEADFDASDSFFHMVSVEVWELTVCW